MGSNKIRQSSFELLRILAMFMIVGLHYFNGIMGGALDHLGENDSNFYIAYFFESFFIVGVNCFILIMGYFQANKKTIRYGKLITLIAQIAFYSIGLYALGVLTNSASLSLREMLQAFFPFIFGIKWFMEAYLITYLLSPFINIGLANLNKREFKILLLILFILFSLWPSVIPSPPVTDRGYGIINFIFVYIIGVYLRLHFNAKHSGVLYFIGYLTSGITIFGASLAAVFLLGRGLDVVWGYNFIFNIFGSVCLFLGFSKLNIQSNIINFTAKFTFGVYLIHADPSIRRLLYDDLLNTSKFWFSEYFLLHFIVTTLLVYIGCTVIDIARLWMFDKFSLEDVSKISQKYLPVLFKKTS